jgi:hypothetical protein
LRLFIITLMAVLLAAAPAMAQYVPQEQPVEPSATPDAEGTGQLCLDLKKQQTYINFDVLIPEPTYDNSRSAKALSRETGQKANQEWLTKNGLDELWAASELSTQGYAATGWQLLPEFYIKPTPVDRFGAWYCPHIMEVNIAILMSTTIRIAKEYVPGTCQYDAIEKHEYKHYLVNKYVVEQGMERMRRDLPAMIRQMEMQGYVGRGMIKERVEIIKQSITDMFKIYLREEMSKQMTELNAKVDTPEEYDRVSKLVKICALKEKMKQQEAKQLRKQEGFSGKIKEMGHEKQ